MAGPRARPKRLVNDGLDGPRAATAFGAAAEAAIELLGAAQKVVSRTHGLTNIMVTQDIAGTDDHKNVRTFGDAPADILKRATGCKRKNHILKQFQTAFRQSLERV
jgi:hypothetical protein